MKSSLITAIHFVLLTHLMADSLESIERRLGEKPNAEILSGVSNDLIEVLEKNDRNYGEKLDPVEKIKALEIIGKHKISSCIPALIDHIEKISNHYDSIAPREKLFPCIDSLVKIGEDAVPKLTEAILNETNEFRLRLLSYTLMKIKSKQGALDHLDQCMKDETSSNQKKSLMAAKAEIGKWRDQ